MARDDMAISLLAGLPAPKAMLIDPAALERKYFRRQPDLGHLNQLVSFGTSGHRGSSLRGTFTEAHVLAITQAICDYRRSQGTDGPLYMGKDTHALSGPAERTALEVLTANNVETVIQRGDGVTPTPVISRAILVHNRGRKQQLADGIIITPSHNPPEDGGFKYNPTDGGPADTGVTRWIEVCLPITPSECINNGGRQAIGLMRSLRLSALVDGAEHPCRAQGACVRHCNMLDNWRADGEHASPPAPRQGRGTRVGSIRSAVQHDRSATANVARLVDLGCPWLAAGV